MRACFGLHKRVNWDHSTLSTFGLWYVVWYSGYAVNKLRTYAWRGVCVCDSHWLRQEEWSCCDIHLMFPYFTANGEKINVNDSYTNKTCYRQLLATVSGSSVTRIFVRRHWQSCIFGLLTHRKSSRLTFDDERPDVAAAANQDTRSRILTHQGRRIIIIYMHFVHTKMHHASLIAFNMPFESPHATHSLLVWRKRRRRKRWKKNSIKQHCLFTVVRLWVQRQSRPWMCVRLVHTSFDDDYYYERWEFILAYANVIWSPARRDMCIK